MSDSAIERELQSLRNERIRMSAEIHGLKRGIANLRRYVGDCRAKTNDVGAEFALCAVERKMHDLGFDGSEQAARLKSLHGETND